jgi:hypothetical protein
MDEQGIDIEALSINPNFWDKAERDLQAQIVKVQNEKLAEVCAHEPARFDPLGADDECRRCFLASGKRGRLGDVAMGMHVDGAHPLAVDDDLAPPPHLPQGMSHLAAGERHAGRHSS